MNKISMSDVVHSRNLRILDSWQCKLIPKIAIMVLWHLFKAEDNEKL